MRGWLGLPPAIAKTSPSKYSYRSSEFLSSSRYSSSVYFFFGSAVIIYSLGFQIRGGDSTSAEPPSDYTLERRLHVINSQRSLVAEVEPSTDHDRISPAWPSLVGNRESSLFDVGVRIGFGQPDDVVFTEQVEHSVSVSQRAFAHAASGPHLLARGEFDAGQDGVGETVKIAVHQDHAAVMVLHVLGEVYLLSLDLAALRAQPEQRPARPVRRSEEDFVVGEDRRRAVGRAVCWRRMAPHELAVAGADADRRARGEIHIRADS